MRVILNDDETMLIKHLASIRAAELLSEDPEKITSLLKEGHIHGARLAVCKALNIFPDLSVANQRDLVSRTNKKISLIYTPEVSILYPLDGKHDVYVAITGMLPEYDLVGYVLKEGVGNTRGIQPNNMFKFREQDVCIELIK